MRLLSSKSRVNSLLVAIGCELALLRHCYLFVMVDGSGIQSRLVDRCCQVGKERAIESPKFNCKLSTREALIGQQVGGRPSLLALSAEALLAREPSFADQCEMVLESCCLAHHRWKNCESGKQFAKSGAACMDVELSKEATMATESFNDCCMSCSLGILAARNQNQNRNETGRNLSDRCKLLSPLASSLSGQLYEQTYNECCHENLPRPSGALLEPGSPIDCNQANPCAQRCVSSSRRLEQDRCDCFSGYKLAADGVNCLDVDECKLGSHTCNRLSEVCDNTRGGFRCLARMRPLPAGSDEPAEQPEFASLRLCPLGSRWNAAEGACEQVSAGNEPAGAQQVQRSSSLLVASSRHRPLVDR